MDDEFIQKMKSFLAETGFEGPINNMDFSFLSEHKEFTKFFFNTTSEDYVSKEELVLAEKLKKEQRFIESEDKLNEILLQSYSCDVSGECISSSDVLCIKDKISEVNENISILERNLKLSESEYHNMKSNLKCTKEELKEEKSRMNNTVQEFISCDKKLNTILQDVKNQYNCYANIFQKKFSLKDPMKHYQMLVPSPEMNVEFSMAKNKVMRYINSCHNYSSIPVSIMNTTALSCDSSFCSTIPSDSYLTILSVELSKIKESIAKNLLSKLLLEAEQEGLVHCLPFLKDITAYELLNLLDRNIIEEDKCDTDIMGHIKQECMKSAECEISRVLINVFESKIFHRNAKLDALDNFLKIVMRYSAIADFLWMLCKAENVLIDHHTGNISATMKSLMDEFTGYLKRKDYMENKIHQVVNKQPSKMNLVLECLQFMLMPASGSSNDEIMNAVEELSKQVAASETNLLAWYKTILQIINKKFSDCEALRTTATAKFISNIEVENDMKAFIINIKSVINELDNKIAEETSKCIVKQVPE